MLEPIFNHGFHTFKGFIKNANADFRYPILFTKIIVPFRAFYFT